MEGSSSTQFVRAPAEGKGKNRLFWSVAEEDCLVIVVKELIVDGWKAGNGWRPGFFGQVETKIRKEIPTSKIRGEPHVLSKITVWKKQYYLLRGLLGASGKEGLHPIHHTITIVGTEKWETSVKVNPDLLKLRNKSFPYYSDWQEMFGVDRANGEAAHDLGSTVQQILRNREVIRTTPLPNNPTSVLPDEEDDALSGARTPARSNTFQPTTSKKRKNKAAFEDEGFTQMMATYMSDTKDALTDLSAAIRSLKEIDPAVSKVYAELEKLPALTVDERVVAANKICANPFGVTLFFSMVEEAKVSFVRNALQGNV